MSKSDSNKYAVFICDYNIGKSSPVICLLDLLSDHHRVDVFIRNTSHLVATVLNRSNIKIIRLDRGIAGKIWHGVWNVWNNIFARIWETGSRSSSTEYRAYICLDPHGFLLCKDMFPNEKPVYYYSLEIYLRTNHFNLPYSKKVMEREHREINSIQGLIIQSEERERIFRGEYNLQQSIPTFILPVTYLGRSEKAKSNLLRNKFKINPATRIALHLGAIREYFSCIELALAFSKISNWVLVFHGHSSGQYLDRLKAVIARENCQNIFVSDEPFELIEDMDSIVMSCDLGIAWYNDLSPNFTTAGRSSGKLSAYLRFGLPVIVNKYRSTMEAIEKPGCGVCVEDFSKIPHAVRKIEMNYQYYSDNSRKEYDEVYWFGNYRNDLIEFIGE